MFKPKFDFDQVVYHVAFKPPKFPVKSGKVIGINIEKSGDKYTDTYKVEADGTYLRVPGVFVFATKAEAEKESEKLQRPNIPRRKEELKKIIKDSERFCKQWRAELAELERMEKAGD